MTVLDEIAAKRQHQISKGYDAAHDDQHAGGEIALGAAAYAMSAAKHPGPGKTQTPVWVPPVWPWDREQFSPREPRDDLIDAAAMIVAEIERLDRLP